MVKYYPVNLDLEGKICIVVGAGSVAWRKAARLLECGGRVRVIGPGAVPGLKALAQNEKILLEDRRFRLSDLAGAFLAVAATTDRKVNSEISSWCRKRGILINVVDCPKECNFTLPSLVRRGDLTISISTEGISPALAKDIRLDLERRFGKEYAEFLRIMKAVRPKVLKEIKDPKVRKAFFQKVVRSGVIDLLKHNKKKQARERLESILKDARQ